MGISDWISSAEAGFASTTGLTDGVAGVVAWTGTNLLQVFIGSGLALLFELRYWIVGLVIIAAIVYFSYRAFLFFRH